MSATWIYDDKRTYSIHSGKKNRDYGLSVVKHNRQPGEVHRVLVTAVCQCLCALRDAAVAKKLYGPFDSFDLGLTDSSVLTGVDEPPLNPQVYFQQQEDKIIYKTFMAKKKVNGGKPDNNKEKKLTDSNVSNENPFLLFELLSIVSLFCYVPISD